MPLLDDLSPPPPTADRVRRKLLGLLGSGALGLATAGTGVTTVAFLEPKVFFEEEARFVVGRPEDIAPGTVLVFASHRTYVVRDEQGFYAVSSTCTHLGCMTRYDPAAAGYTCPCHGSRFRLDGAVAAGPAPRPLPRLELTLEQGRIVVNTRKHVPQGERLRVT